MAYTFNSASDRIAMNIAANFPATGSLCMWLKPTWNHNDSVNHVFFQAYTDANNFFTLQKYSDNNFYCGWKSSGTDYRATAAAAGIVSGNWHSIICTWDDTANQTYFYIDGTTRASNTSTLVTNTISANPVWGNADAGSGNVDLAGDLAEIALWNRVLTSGERAAIDGGASPDAGGTSGDWLAYRSCRENAIWADSGITLATHPTITASPPVGDVRSGVKYHGDVHTGTLSVSSGGGLRLAGHGGLCS